MEASKGRLGCTGDHLVSHDMARRRLAVYCRPEDGSRVLRLVMRWSTVAEGLPCGPRVRIEVEDGAGR